jgi:hypothetical protein
MRVKGRKSHQLVLRAENNARHRTPGSKRFVHVALNDRGTISPDYSMASIMAMSMVMSIAAKARSAMIRGRGGR